MTHSIKKKTHSSPVKAVFLLLALSVTAAACCPALAAPAQTPQNAASPQVTALQNQLKQLNTDWANLGRYRTQNASLGPPASGERRVVFMGDSITDAWINMRPDFFQKNSYLDRGISGQTTPQMLVRFWPDVIALKPAVVVILAGTNDIAGNTGPSTPEMIEENFMAMTDLARMQHIKVVLASILPAYDYPWKPGTFPADKIAALNAWIKSYAASHHCVYLDYYSAMVDSRRGMKAALTIDGVHPNAAGYAVMEPLAERAIAKALK